MSINITEQANAVFQANVVTAYPCSIPKSAIGVFELASNSWSPIGFAVNTISCRISYNTTIDPIIGIFVQSQFTTTTTTSTVTTTIPSTGLSGSGGGGGGGGSSGGGGGGGGGSSKPVVASAANGYNISNIAQLNTVNVTLEGRQINIVENYITPTSAGVTINGNSSYTMSTGRSYFVASGSNYSIYVRLLNVSYIPIEQTIMLYVYSNSTSTPTNSTQPLNVSLSISNLTSLRIVPESLSNVVFVGNVLSSTPAAPSNYMKLGVIYISVNSSAVDSIRVSADYGCGTPSTDITPFYLQNQAWIPINPFTINSTSCQVSFMVVKNQIFAIMQLVRPITTTTIRPTTTIAATIVAATAPPPSSGIILLQNWLLILSALILAAGFAGAAYVYVRRYGFHLHVTLARRHIISIAIIGLVSLLLIGAYAYTGLHYPGRVPTSFNRTVNSTTSTSSVSTTTIAAMQTQAFKELGLPIGTTWYVQLGTNLTSGAVESGVADQRLVHLNSTAGYINFTVPAGIYYYTIREVPGYNLMYYQLRNQGYLNVTGGYGSTQSAAFVQCTSDCNASTQTVSFERFGLPVDTEWSVNVNGTTESSNSLFINFTEPLGQHPYEVSPVSNYRAYPSQSSVNLTSGSSIYTVSITFVK